MNKKPQCTKIDPEKYRVLDAICDHVCILDKDLNILWANRTAQHIFGKNLVDRKCYEVFHNCSHPCEPSPCLTLKVFQDRKGHEHETHVIDKKSQKIYFHCKANVLEKDADGLPTAVIEISRDITQQRLAEASFAKLKESLEKKVLSRTRELELKKTKLEDANIALRVLMENQQNEKETLQENILTNIKQSVEPYFEKLKRSALNVHQRTLMEMIEIQIGEITSSFSCLLTSGHVGLTARELQIADLIRVGKTSKEISTLLNISPHTVDTHRRNIRKKLDFNGGRESLRSHLIALN